MNLIKYLPNTFTVLNLLSGCLGLLNVYEGNLIHGALFIIIGAVFDFLDGFTARLLKAMSELGKQLDSLADLVTFGILPAFLMYALLEEQGTGHLALVSLLIVVGSAFRLAQFNIDESQNKDFKGLPTPANAFLIAGLIFVEDSGWTVFSLIYDSVTGLVLFTLICSLLLNVPLRFMSFKIREYTLKGNEYNLILILLTLFFLLAYGYRGIFPATLCYLLLSFIQNLIPGKSAPGRLS